MEHGTGMCDGGERIRSRLDNFNMRQGRASNGVLSTVDLAASEPSFRMLGYVFTSNGHQVWLFQHLF